MTASSFDAPVRLDGNAAAGVLREVFTAEMTAAYCRCADCGSRSAVGALHLYGGAMGSVLRCPSCEALVLAITADRRDRSSSCGGSFTCRRHSGGTEIPSAP